jgi:hypothetical protein
MRRWTQNLTDDRYPTWRDGRGWWGKWHAEWKVLRPGRWFAIGIEKGAGDGNAIMAHLCLPGFTLYVSREFRHSFGERELSCYWYEGSLWLKLWIDDEYRSDRPWHRNTVALHVKDRILGRPAYSLARGEPVPILIPMPEGCYEATATPETATWTRRFGIKTTWEGWDIAIPGGGIPHEGKGENSWDCGEDGLCGIGCEGTLEQAIGKVVAASLRNRKRYGGKHSHRDMAPQLARSAT